MKALKESWRRRGRYFMLLLLLFVLATALLVILAGDAQEGPFNYVVH